MKSIYKKIIHKDLRIKIYTTKKYLLKLISKRRFLQKKYERKFISRYGYNVMSGPFAGMNYISEASGSSYLAKLVGYYEESLHASIADIKKDDYDSIIDIGVAEGYYLIGFGLHFSKARLYGFDINTRALALTKNLAQKNDISSRLELNASCNPEKLDKILTDKTLLICDAEGFEKEILDPVTCRKLANVKTILVETHDHKMSGRDASTIIIKRFEKTHKIEKILLEQANPNNYDFLTNIRKNDLKHLLRERTTNSQITLVLHRK